MQCARKSDSICSPVLNDQVLKTRFNQECLNKKSCNLPSLEDYVRKYEITKANTGKVATES